MTFYSTCHHHHYPSLIPICMYYMVRISQTFTHFVFLNLSNWYILWMRIITNNGQYTYVLYIYPLSYVCIFAMEIGLWTHICTTCVQNAHTHTHHLYMSNPVLWAQTFRNYTISQRYGVHSMKTTGEYTLCPPDAGNRMCLQIPILEKTIWQSKFRVIKKYLTKY